jgi:hypothetical protein
MNVFIILSILIIVIGVLLLVATPSVLFKLNWSEKTGKEKILMFMFYSILVYIINIIYWIIKWVGGVLLPGASNLVTLFLSCAHKTSYSKREAKVSDTFFNFK